jgi:hypothetical protein
MMMNAAGAKRFPRRIKNFSPDIFKPDYVDCVSSAASCSSQEIVMSSSRKRHWIKKRRISYAAIAAAPATASLLWANAAFASQGPGGGPGTASGFTQLVMAIVVWGTSALVVGAGLIGAVRGR